MATKPTPRIQFSGGPLDGEVRSKTNPGRWSTYLDTTGTPFHGVRLADHSEFYALDRTEPDDRPEGVTGSYSYRSVK